MAHPILDRNTYAWARREAADLFEMLVVSIPQPAEIARLYQQAGGEAGSLNTAQAARPLWGQALELLAQGGALRKLCEEVLPGVQRLANNTRFQAALHAAVVAVPAVEQKIISGVPVLDRPTPTSGEARDADGAPLETSKPDEATLRRLPELPRNFIPREAFLRPLRERVLIGKGVGVTAARATALKGMGGLGKTVLATALVYDPAVAARFGRERYWISMGQKRQPFKAQADLFRDVTGQNADFDEWQVGRKRLKEVLSGRSRLIVIDDIWMSSQAEAFEGLGKEAVLLITTRQGEVLQRLDAEPVSIDVLNLEQSRELLAGWAGIDIAELPACADDVIKECGRLPLALATFGAAVAMSEFTWVEGLKELQRHKLEDLKRPLQGYDGNEGVFGAIALSFNALAAADREAFARCAVFPEDRPIPESALWALWHDRPEFHHGDRTAAIRQLCNRIENASLWRREHAGDAQRSYRIHDLVSDYLQARLDNPIGTHSVLIEGYREQCPARWVSGPNDGYFFQFLPYHMAEANEQEALSSLLLSYEWIERKMAIAGAPSLLADYELIDNYEDVHLVARALRQAMPVIMADPRQLRGQLIGRLLGLERSAIRQLIAQCDKGSTFPWLRPLWSSLERPVHCASPYRGTTVRREPTRPVKAIRLPEWMALRRFFRNCR